MDQRSEVSWICQIALVAHDRAPIDDDIAQDFFQFAQDWVEENGLQMGGMYYGESRLEDPIWDEIADLLEDDSEEEAIERS